jgi:hypothetical protein
MGAQGPTPSCVVHYRWQGCARPTPLCLQNSHKEGLRRRFAPKAESFISFSLVERKVKIPFNAHTDRHARKMTHSTSAYVL